MITRFLYHCIYFELCSLDFIKAFDIIFEKIKNDLHITVQNKMSFIFGGLSRFTFKCRLLDAYFKIFIVFFL